MKPGDLIRIVFSCNGTDGTLFEAGDIGILIGPARDDFNQLRGCHLLLVNDRFEDFGDLMFEVIDETR